MLAAAARGLALVARSRPSTQSRATHARAGAVVRTTVKHRSAPLAPRPRGGTVIALQASSAGTSGPVTDDQIQPPGRSPWLSPRAPRHRSSGALTPARSRTTRPLGRARPQRTRGGPLATIRTCGSEEITCAGLLV